MNDYSGAIKLANVVKIWQSFNKNKLGHFFDPPCISVLSVFSIVYYICDYAWSVGLVIFCWSCLLVGNCSINCLVLLCN